MSFKTAPVHQGYIEPHACLARFDADGQAEIWASSQGHFVVRALTARLLGMNIGDLLRASGRDRRRLRRQDRRLCRAGGGRAVAQDRPSGEDRDEPGGRVQGHRTDLRLVDDGQDRRQEGRQDRRRRRPVQVPGGRLPRLAGDERAACAASRPTTSRTCARSATTWSAIGRSRPPTARPARRSRPSRWRASWTWSRPRSAWIRCSSG